MTWTSVQTQFSLSITAPQEQQLDSKSANKQPEAAVQAGQRAGHLARFILVLPLDSGGQVPQS